jgi:hypothetical protein
LFTFSGWLFHHAIRQWSEQNFLFGCPSDCFTASPHWGQVIGYTVSERRRKCDRTVPGGTPVMAAMAVTLKPS